MKKWASWSGAMRVVAVALLGAGVAPAFAQQVYRLQERAWLAYDPDQSTLGLFHLDQHPRVGADKAIEDVDADPTAKPEGKAPQLLGGLGPAGGTKKQETGPDRVRDESTQGRAARLVGKTEWLEKGKIGGALKLLTTDAAMVTPDYPAFRAGGGFTVEAWYRCERDIAGVVLSLPSGSPSDPPIEVRRQPGGAVQLLFDGKPVADVSASMPTGKWTHVALLAYPPRPVPGKYAFRPRNAESQLVLLVDTLPAGMVEDKRVAQVTARLAGQVYFGNAAGFSSGLSCELDEARVSQGDRTHYRMRLASVHSEVSREIPIGPPLLRSAEDQVAYLGFEGSIAPQGAAAAEVTSPTGAVPDPAAKSPRLNPPVFFEGVHGQALVVGGKLSSVRVSGSQSPALVDLARGSIELWFSPLDWDNRERQKQLGPLDSVPLFKTLSAGGDEKRPYHLSVSIVRMQDFLEANPPAVYMNPGTWYHLVVAWDGPKTTVFLNGTPAPAGIVAVDRVAPPAGASIAAPLLVGPSNAVTDPGAHSTLIDEVRIYRRALFPEEAVNVYGRYLPEPRVTPLDYARVSAWLSTPTKQLHVATAILAGDITKTRQARFTLLQAEKDEAVMGPFTLPLSAEGTAEGAFPGDSVDYGEFRIKTEVLGDGNAVLHTKVSKVSNPRPEWMGNTLGIHEGEVLPGWDAMKFDKNVVSMSLKAITLAPTGWPTQIRAADKDMLAQPVQVHAKAGGSELAWKATGDAVTAEHIKPDRVVTRGEAASSGWKMSTRMTSEFDGLVKIETTLTPTGEGTLDELTIDFPFKNECAAYYGFWTGHQNFRAACDYRAMPQKTGVIFASNNPGRAVNAEISGSFVPFVVLADDQRAVNWFAENDKGWTKTREKPAVELVRDEAVTTLRLHVIQATTKLNEPLTVTFGLHLAPVKAPNPKRRSMGLTADFGFVDSFSKQSLKTDFATFASFMLLPVGGWDAAAERAAVHTEQYGMSPYYRGPILYVDRNYIFVPPSAGNFVPIWLRSGAMRYLPEARDMIIWCMNQWLERKLIYGIYIDDVWGQPMKDPNTGPAYKLADGAVQPGFEFFDFNTYMRRLRWLFHDNKLSPYIWLHATQTFYLPIVSYADFSLDGEDRFPEQGAKTDFIASWGLPRLQFNSPAKWGVATNWMFKAGGPSGTVLPQFKMWAHRQFRVYHAGCMLHDLSIPNERPEASIKIGAADDAATFYGYWQTGTPLTSASKDVIASLYVTPGRGGQPRLGIVAFNLSDKPQLAELNIDLAKLGLSSRAASLAVSNPDPAAPQGEDPTQTVTPKKMTADVTEKKSATAELLNEFERDITNKDPSRGEDGWFDDRNQKLESGRLRARILPRNYRVFVIE